MKKSTEPQCSTSATLILLGDDLNPDLITERLGLVPSQAWRRGETKNITGQNGVTRFYDSVYEWGGWKLWLPEERRDSPFWSQITYWERILEDRAEEVKACKAEGLTVELNCYIGGPANHLFLTSEFQAFLGSLGVDLDITYYTYQPKRREKRQRPRTGLAAQKG